jgi:hypothetical protein
MTIFAGTFQPFESRRGLDEVVRLQFRYDPQLVEDLKRMLRSAKRATGVYPHCGGWLAERRRWFCERSCWPSVRQQLERHGHSVVYLVPRR